MSKRLFEVAREMGISSNELTERIDSLNLSFNVKNHLTVLNERQLDELREKLNTGSKSSQVEKVVGKGLIRRRTRRRAAAEEDAPEAAPAVRRRKVVAAEPEPVEAEPPASEAVVAEAEAEEEVVKPRKRRRIATVVTRTEEPPAPEPIPEPAPEPEAPVEEAEPEVVSEPEPAQPTETTETAPAPKRSRFATVVTRTPEEPASAEPAEAPEAAAAAEELAEATPPPRRSRFATVHTNPAGEPAVPSSNNVVEERMALARKEADAAASGKGGAKVLGTMNDEVLRNRLEADQKDFGPRRPTDRSAKDRRGRKGGKRVVDSRNLYDRNRRKTSKRSKSNQPAQTTRITTAAEHKRVVKMEDSILVSDLGMQMGVKAGEVAMKLMFDLGVKGANINTAIDFDTAQLVAELYGYKVEQIGFELADYLPKLEASDDDLAPRPAVVTVMGHVDHGKTSLLDAIRASEIASGEAGGITQHIGAYLVHTTAGNVCFLDTPGHEAFTALRARGALATDIVVLVVAADDGVMPQTVEAINHARDADVPLIVAVNKIDKPGANVERVKQALTEYELVPEEWGGQTIYVETSALTGVGVDTLLEMLALQAEVMELKANPKRPAEGIVIESRLDIGRGPVASVLVQQGTLEQGDIIVFGKHYGRVRTMTDERNQRKKLAIPSTPIEVTGINGVPTAGEKFYVVQDEKSAKTIAEHIGQKEKQSELAVTVAADGEGGLDSLMTAGKLKELKIIIKGDVQGSVEALKGSLEKLSTEDVRVRIIHAAVGGITESDINLAASSEEGTRCVVIGFNVRPDNRAQSLADQLNVKVVTQSIIYEIIDGVTEMMRGLLDPVFVEEVLGHAEVRATFGVPKIGTVAGCMVTDGKIERNGKCRVFRDSIRIFEGEIGSLRHFENDVKEVKSGFECGINVDRFNDVQIGDVIECYRINETEATL